MIVVGTHLHKIALYRIVANYSVKSYLNRSKQSTSLLLLPFVKYCATTTTVTAVTGTNQNTFAVSYLINTCGLSPESALSASEYILKYAKFETPDKSDSVLNCLKSHGFSQTQISNFVRGSPTLIVMNAEKNIAPKLEFFRSKGVSSADLARVFSVFPSILTRSLEKYIIPSYNFLKSLIKSDEKTSRAFVSCPLIISQLESHVKPNINVLRISGVPESNISTLLQNWPATTVTKCEWFNENVNDVKAMGFNPSKITFVIAVKARSRMAKSKWERKVALYESWGWSKEEFLVAFKKHPWCMMVSENKINAIMDFLINKMGYKSSYIAWNPIFISFSLEKRVVPRCSVIKVLLSKGLVEQTCLASMLRISDEQFVQKLVTDFQKEAPNLLKLYQEKLDLS